MYRKVVRAPMKAYHTAEVPVFAFLCLLRSCAAQLGGLFRPYDCSVAGVEASNFSGTLLARVAVATAFQFTLLGISPQCRRLGRSALALVKCYLFVDHSCLIYL